jgi:hypothetical protein
MNNPRPGASLWACVAALVLLRVSDATENRKGPFADDERLSKAVTAVKARITLGELLEQVGKQTGVKLEASNRWGPISGYEVTVSFTDRPASELLGAVARLYSTPPDRWWWERTRRGAYVLRNSMAPQDAAELMVGFRERFLVDQHARLREFYGIPERQRDHLAEQDPMLKANNSARSAGFFSFIDPLKEPELLALSRGGRIDLPVGGLRQAQRDFVNSEFRMAQPRMNGDLDLGENLQSLRLFGDPDGSIYLQMGRVGAHAVLGGVWRSAAEKDFLLRRWLGPGESRRPPASAVPAAEEKDPSRPEKVRITRARQDLLLLRLATLGRVDLLFDRPPVVSAGRYGADFTLEGPLPEVLHNLERFDLLWKWSNAAVLLRRADWPWQRAKGVVPWSELRALRATAAANHGYLRPDDWLRLSAYSRDQLESLAEEFPDAGRIALYQLPLRLAASLKPAERDAAARPGGAGWNDLSPETRGRLTVLYPDGEARMARLLVGWETSSSPQHLLVYLGRPTSVLRPIEVPFAPQSDLSKTAE